MRSALLCCVNVMWVEQF